MQPLLEKILAEIPNQGAISFARFMELALYCPVYGYYEKEGDTVGRRGDYYTSVSVGPLFGELLARQFSQWLAQMEPSSRAPFFVTPRGVSDRALLLLEAGAHDGALARDILRWLHHHEPALARTIQYWLIEPSDRRQARQRKTLAEFASQVGWVKNLEAFAPAPNAAGQSGPWVRGVIFSNELLDAMPVHRLGWDPAQGAWFEWGVGFRDGRFEWVRLGDRDAQEHRPVVDLDPFSVIAQPWADELLRALPHGFALEICPAATRWWTQAATMLESGKLITLDYGLEELEWLSPARPKGTLRGYHGHSFTEDALARPGEQDLTAHVNFSALIRAGEAAGLATEGLVTQEQFLTRIAVPLLEGRARPGDWTAQHTRQFQTLTHPGHLGRSFRVLVQSRSL